MVTKPGKMVTYREGLPPILSHEPFNVWSRGIMWQIKNISTTTVSSAIPYSRKVTRYEISARNINAVDELYLKFLN